MTASLAELQRHLQRFLLDTDRRDGAAPVPAIRATGRVPSDVRLGIYVGAYRARLLEALTADYAGLKSYLGDEAFAALGHAYIDAQPSRHFSLRWFGAMLADFVAATAPYSQHIELADIACFEWAQGLVFDAADIVPRTIADLAALPAVGWPALRLALTPALQTVTLHSNAPALWSALNENHAPPDLELQAPTVWLLWRHELRILFRSLPACETIALQAFAAGASFADVCTRLCDVMTADEVPAYTAGLLRYWLDNGLIAAIIAR